MLEVSFDILFRVGNFSLSGYIDVGTNLSHAEIYKGLV